MLAHDPAEYSGRIGSDLTGLALGFDHIEHLLRRLWRQCANLGGDVFPLPLGQFRRIGEFWLLRFDFLRTGDRILTFASGFAALFRGRYRLSLFLAGWVLLGRCQRDELLVAVLGFRVLVLNTTTTTLDCFGFRRVFRGGGGVWGGGGSSLCGNLSSSLCSNLREVTFK